MAKGITGLPPIEYDPLGSLPGKGGPLHQKLVKGIKHSTDTAEFDYNCHSDVVDPAARFSRNVGGPYEIDRVKDSSE